MSASAGRVLLIPKGEYDSSVTYTMLDMVRYNNVTYVCKKTTTGNAPDPAGDNEWWQFLVRGSSVIGVKGNAESTYRDGNVNITPADIGILPFSGSTASIGGTSIPPVGLSDNGKFLKASGGWESLPVFQGVSGSEVSIAGIVPPAQAGDERSCLMGDGTWAYTQLYKVVLSGISSLSSCRFPTTGTNPAITSDMELTEAYLSNSAATVSELDVNFFNGYLTITGTLSGTTDITLKFQRAITLS